jgi:hypothetical protein
VADEAGRVAPDESGVVVLQQHTVLCTICCPSPKC